MKDYDIIFLVETHCNCSSMPIISGFEIIGDPSFPLITSHGGIVVYIKEEAFECIQHIRFSKSSVSFKLSFAPNIVFMGVYVYPYDSHNYGETDYAALATEVGYWLGEGYIPFIGGDFNGRIGDLSELSSKSLKWRYDDNVDKVLNQHGKALRSICELHKILPLNHSKYYDISFDGCFTYFKAEKKSQIDFLLTNNKGRQLIDDFSIKQTGWHASDHLPLEVTVSFKAVMSADIILKRSNELKPYVPSQQPLLRINRYMFNEELAVADMLVNANSLHAICIANQNNPDKMLEAIESYVVPILSGRKLRNEKAVKKDVVTNNCDFLFHKYILCLDDVNHTQEELSKYYADYQKERNKLNYTIMKQHEDQYAQLIKTKDDKKMWQKIDWAGNLKRGKAHNQPAITDLADHFENLYQPLHEDDIKQLDQIHSDVYIPVNDDAISQREVYEAASTMKKGGWDFSLPVMKLLTQSIPACLLLLLNAMFFCAYPLKLSLSILHAIPKIGNLALPINYRGIQVQPMLGILFDRILASRLTTWAKISPEQTAFQKGKSTLNHIFTLRLLIALAKRYKKCLYIAFFDLSKAFDKVSRVLLLRSLIKLGIGSCLLEAIKATYKVTRCVLNGFGKLSDVFCTFSGIKQGAPSSVILFIIFMDDVIANLKEKCINEFLLNNLHILLHADDTLIFSFEHNLFIIKCNVLIDSFHDKKLQLNLKKSCYMIVHAKSEGEKVDLRLKSGWLPYSSSVTYLGSLFSDSGHIGADITQHALNKSKGVDIKLANFVTNNLCAPITVKYKVLNSCVTSSILYSCETWSACNLARIESLHRKAIKTCTQMKSKTPNDIVYVESGLPPLTCAIYKRQHKLWQRIKDDIESNPESPIAKLYKIAIIAKIPYLKHYIDLHETFANEHDCYKFYLQKDLNGIQTRLRLKAESDNDGIQGTYLRINTNLETPLYYHIYTIREPDRAILTKYRTGSHSLNVQRGRSNCTQRADRLCKCKLGIQDLNHVLFHCNLTQDLRHQNFQYKNLFEFFSDTEKAPDILRAIEHILKLR